MKLGQITDYLETLVPLEWQEPWDKSGLQIGGRDREIRRILVALDINKASVQKAIELNADLIISHHPLFFNPLEAIRDDRAEEALVRQLIEHEISVYSMHTNLDRAPWGVNFALAKAFNLDQKLSPDPLILPAMPLAEPDLEDLFLGSEAFRGRKPGFGLVCVSKTSRFELLAQSRVLGLGPVQANFDRDEELSHIVFSGGSWDSAWLGALEERQIQMVITGEMKHHDREALLNRNIGVLALGHDVSEKQVLVYLLKWLENLNATCKEEDQLALEVFYGLDYSLLPPV